MGKSFTNTGACQITIAHVTFPPGSTKMIPSPETLVSWKAKDPKADTDALTTALLAGVEKSPAFKAGILKPGVVAMPPARPTPSAASLTDLTLGEATAQVRICTDLDTLAGWHTTETRPVIKDMITNRATELTKKG
jgi:hypothetical protein